MVLSFGDFAAQSTCHSIHSLDNHTYYTHSVPQPIQYVQYGTVIGECYSFFPPPGILDESYSLTIPAYLFIYFLLLRACCSTLAVSSTCGTGKMFPPVTGSWRCIWLSRCGAEITTTATAVRIPSTPSGATPRFRGVFE